MITPTVLQSDFFDQYAVNLLLSQNQEVEEALKRRHIPPNQIRSLLEVYSISLRLGNNIPLHRVKKQICQQLKAVAYFIRDFHIAIFGQETGVFQLHEIEIHIRRGIKPSFIFEFGKLLIQIPYLPMGFLFHPLAYPEIKRLWRRGDHLAKDSPFRRVWWLFNPIGEFRSQLREMLSLAAQKHIIDIDKLFQSQSFKQEAIAFFQQTVNGDKLEIPLSQLLSNLDDTTLTQLLTLFKQNLADVRQIEELINAAALTLQEEMQKEQSRIDIKMFGFVNVGNYHRVDVAVNIASGYFKKYVELVPRRVAVKAVLLGFVNVYTIDDITVKPTFNGAMSIHFETAALAQALKQLQILP